MSNYFKSTKLGGDSHTGNESMFDAGDAMGNQGFTVIFQHVPSGKIVRFKAFINALNETYSSDWNSESVYGRTDPIQMFKQTTRNITLSLMVPASSHSEAYQNLAKVDELVTYLYPSYESIDNALTIAQSPLIRLSVMNLIKNNSVSKKSYQSLRSKTKGNLGGSDGLLGIIKSLSVNHNIESIENGSFMLPGGKILPKAIELTLDFTAIHEKTIGWQNGSLLNDASIYGTDIAKSEPGGNNGETSVVDNINPLGGTPTDQGLTDVEADAAVLVSDGRGGYVMSDGSNVDWATVDLSNTDIRSANRKLFEDLTEDLTGDV